ncbi:MAG: DNA-binding domain-containing protein [Hyphomicrobium sp.]
MAGNRANFAPLKIPALSLADTQALFQKALLDGDTSVLDHLRDTSRTNRTTLFGVYAHAYRCRLVEILRHDYEYLAALMGNDAFEEMARAFVTANPSRFQNARWFGSGLADFLRANDAYASNPVFADLAGLEKAFADAFDARDATAISIDDLAAYAPEDWGCLTFAPHPAVSLLSVATNVLAVWTAIKAAQTAPSSMPASQARSNLVIWRFGVTPMVREMNLEEAMMWREVCRGRRFDALCEMAATYEQPEHAAMRTAGYLQGWLTSQMLSSATLDGANGY